MNVGAFAGCDHAQDEGFTGRDSMTTKGWQRAPNSGSAHAGLHVLSYRTYRPWQASWQILPLYVADNAGVYTWLVSLLSFSAPYPRIFISGIVMLMYMKSEKSQRSA